MANLNDLKNLDPGYLPYDVFMEIARLGVLTAMELIPLRQTNNGLEVLLTKREPNDKFWPNMYHNPGTVLRPTDKMSSFVSSYERLFKDELQLDIMPKVYFGGFYLRDIARGKGLGIICWAEVNHQTIGEFFKIDSLPDNIVPLQYSYIKKCAGDYNNYKNGTYKPTLLEDLIIQ